MDWQQKINQIIDYLENRMHDEIDFEKAAMEAGYSLWEYQRVFSFMTNITVGTYVRKRKLSLAANDILAGDEKIIDISLKYGYESPAAFSRAFNQLFGVSPSFVRGTGTPLKLYPKIVFKTIEEERMYQVEKKSNLELYNDRGYYVKENEPRYTSQDMDRTITWFTDVLGWFGGVIARDENGAGLYGGVSDYPPDLPEHLIIPGLPGFQLTKGEPSKEIVGFIKVQGLEKLRQYVLDKGWKQITEIETQPYGTKELYITTVDGCKVGFFEIIG